MRSALARLGFKRMRKDEVLQQRRKDEERAFAPILHSGTKGDGTAPPLNGARYFSFEELKKCTDNFSKRIGEDAFGKVYEGRFTNGLVVTIKRVKEDSFFGREGFESEIEVLSRIHHKNIVRLKGFCCEQKEKLLVYEFISNGTLRDNLNGKGGTYLDWQKRLQIALDTARGLAYLHELANPLIIHRDIKSTDILLDENLNAKVTNFGLSKLVSEKQKGHVSSQGRGILARVESAVKGTSGYVDPEYAKTGVLSEKTDVYSFGVVMLELLTSRWGYDNVVRKVMRAIDENDQEYYGLRDLITTIWPCDLFKELDDATDQNDKEYYGLRDIIDPKIANQVTDDDLRKFVQLALKCLQYSAADRPSMSEVMKEIDTMLQHDGGEKNNNY